MDLTQLANLGEFVGGVGSAVGAIAVLATLIYLAVQVRHSIRAARIASFRSAKVNFNHLNSLLATTPEMADIWMRGAQDRESLAPVEQLRFAGFASCYFNLFETLFEESRDGIAIEQWRVEERDIRILLGMPGVRTWWKNNLISYSDAFRNHVDRLLEEPPMQTDAAGLRPSEQSGSGGANA